jgi:hypothetical protein
MSVTITEYGATGYYSVVSDTGVMATPDGCPIWHARDLAGIGQEGNRNG